MSSKTSPFSKMYLVSPAVYEKLLRCLDEADLQLTEQLNKPPSATEEMRPSEKAIERIHAEEITSAAKPAINKQALQEALASVPSGAPLMEPNPQDYMPRMGVAMGRDPHAAVGYSVVPESDEDMPLSIRFPQRRMITHNPEKVFESVGPDFGRLTESTSFEIPSHEQQAIEHQPLLPDVSQPRAIQPIMPSIRKDFPIVPSIKKKTKPRLIIPEFVLPKTTLSSGCADTPRGTICSINAPQARTKKAPSVNVCQTCGTTFTRKYDLKRHMLSKHGIEPEPSYRRWMEDVDERMEEQGVKRTQSNAGIKNLNPLKVSRVVKDPEQTGSGTFKKWK